MNERYIELNSMYRNRNLWPLESEFEIPISQTGTKNKNNADDAVCLSTPVFSWTSNNLLVSNIQTYQIAGAAYIEDVTPIKNTTDPIILTLKIQDFPPQMLRNYYNTLVLYDNASSRLTLRRIINSSYIGKYTSGGTTWYRLQITLIAYLSDLFNLGDIISISDPTDFSDPYVPLIFVPSGSFQENAYISYILYNETCNQYRPILRYDIATNMIQLDTSGSSTSTYYSGPITSSWQTTDNLSIRKEPPIVPLLGNSNPTVFNTITVGTTVYTTDTSTIIVSGNGLSTIDNFYKNDFLRILPFGSSVSNTDERYEYEPSPSNNQSRCIIEYKYVYDDITTSYYGIFKVNPGFNITYPLYDTVTLQGAKIEVLGFSYDNFNPFTYTGSLVSQQNMSCYEVQLLSLILPNAVLKTGEGGRIAFYPYVYVQLSNVSASSSGNKHVIYSNNPNSTNAIFIVPIFDVQNPSNTPFVRITGANMTQIIKFKPNDNLYFKVILTNGNSYKTVLTEKFSPSAPNAMSQISAMFSFKRIQ